MKVGTNSQCMGTCIEGWDEFMYFSAIYHNGIWGNSVRFSEMLVAMLGICVFDGTKY